MPRPSANTIREVITVQEHLDRVLAATGRLEVEKVRLEQACGRCLAADVTAAVPVPPWTNSAMDGYAVRAADIQAATPGEPARLKVVADIPAGSGEDPALAPGEAARIMTGAPLPTAADTVVPHELTDSGMDVVKIDSPLPRGRHVRNAGEDRSIGEKIASAGIEITPESLAAIASAGICEVAVHRRPKLTVISTGDELVAPGQALGRGQIPDSNGLLISLIARQAGAVTSTCRTGDRPEDLARAIDDHRESADILVVTGGVSVGAYDPVKSLFEGDGRIQFDRVAMQPGKPQAFGQLGEGGPLFFGLPGNPVSTWVSFQMFVRPSLRKLQGYQALTPDPVPASAAEDWSTPPERMQVIPVSIRDGEFRAVSPAASGGSGSHLVGSLANADGYALVEADVTSVRRGDQVLTVRLRDPELFNHQQRSNL